MGTLAPIPQICGRKADIQALGEVHDGQRLRFRHDLIRDSIYEDLPAGVRRPPTAGARHQRVEDSPDLAGEGGPVIRAGPGDQGADRRVSGTWHRPSGLCRSPVAGHQPGPSR